MIFCLKFESTRSRLLHCFKSTHNFKYNNKHKKFHIFKNVYSQKNILRKPQKCVKSESQLVFDS